MKRKLTISSLAKSNLKHRKKQYTAMIIGILLAMIFSSTITFFTSSVFSSMNEYEKSHFGNCDFFILSEKLDEEFYQKALEEDFFSKVGLAHFVGTVYPQKDREEYSVKTAWLDESAKELSYMQITEGRYPEKAGEILFEKATLSILGLDVSVGDSFTLYFKGQDGENLLQKGEERTFTLVGIATDKRQNYFLRSNDSVLVPGAFVSSEEKLAPGSKELIGSYADYADKNREELFSNLIDYLEKGGEVNPYDRITFIKSESDGAFIYMTGNTFLFVLVAIVFSVVLLLASFIAIINAMNSNFSDRKKQIGMLRTVGATKRQIRKIFGREAILISFICAPVSVLISYFVTKIIISFFFTEDMIFVPNFLVLILCGIFGVLSVIVASVVPLYSASKISPVQSIRNIEITRQMKRKKIKSRENFKVSNLIAKRNLTFYKRKQIVVSFFLVVTVVLSTFGFSLLNYEKNNFYRFYSYDYKIAISSRSGGGYFNVLQYNNGFSENQKRDIENSGYFDQVNGDKDISVLVAIDEYDTYLSILESKVAYMTFEDYYDAEGNGLIDEENLFTFSESYYEAKELCEFEDEFFSLSLHGLEGRVIETFKSQVIDGEINIDKLNSGEEVILIAPKKVAYGYDGMCSWSHCDEHIDKDKETYLLEGELSFKAGEEFEIAVLTGEVDLDDETVVNNPQVKKKTVKVGAIISPIDSEYMHFGDREFSLLTTNSALSYFMENAKYLSFGCYLKDEYLKNLTYETDKEITNYLSAVSGNFDGGAYSYSAYENEQETKTTIKMLFMALLSIMILLLCGSASIINNSLTSSIKENKREMGTLRAVGATQKDLAMSYIRQLLSMFGWGTGIGFGITLLIFAGIGIYEKVKDVKYMIELDLLPAAAASVILLLICSFNLYLKIKKETKNSIIDNIREL